jgi:putative lipoprotein
MKFWYVMSGAALAVALAGCADKSANIPVPAPGAELAGQPVIAQPNVSGSIYIRQKVAIPPDAALTVTLSDASQANAPAKVLAQRVVVTQGKQAPFHFVLPFNPADIQPDARILLSAAITLNNKVIFMTESVKAAVNNGGTKIDLTLVPATSVAMPTQSGAATTVPLTSPTQITPSSSVPAPTSL